MPNLIQMSEQLKGVPDEFLEQQVEPKRCGASLLSVVGIEPAQELRSQMAAPPTSTVAQDVVQQQPPPGMMQQPGMQGMDVLGGQQPQVPQAPHGGMPMPAGLGGLGAPMPQGPPAPQRMSMGGLVGTGEDRMIGGPGVFRRGYFSGGPVRMAAGGIGSTSRIRFPWEEEEGIERTPEGGWMVRQGGKSYPVSPRPEFKFPEWKAPEKLNIARPELSTYLKQIQDLYPKEEGPSVLDRRIGELETQRDEIRRPRFGDALIETGLGMLGSKQLALNPLGAMGEAGRARCRTIRRGRRWADRTKLGITERLASVAMAKEEQERRARQDDLRSASDLASKEYGANMVEAQARMGQESAFRQWELEKAKAEAAAGEKVYGIQSGLEMARIQKAMETPKLTPEEEEARQRRIIEFQQQMQKKYHIPSSSGLGGLSGYGRTLPEGAVEDIAKSTVQTEAMLWDKDPKEDYTTHLRRVANQAADQVALNKRGFGFELNPWDRERVIAAMRTYQPHKDQDKAFITKLRERFKPADQAAAALTPEPGSFGRKGIPPVAGGKPTDSWIWNPGAENERYLKGQR